MDTLSLYILTWNIAEKLPPADLDLTELLSLKRDQDHLPDLYVIGLQEAKIDYLTGQWETAFKNSLKQFSYVEMNIVRLLGIVMFVFARERYITKVRNMETGSTATGILNIIGNKGAVTFRMDLCGVSVCIVNSHLAAHDGHLEERVTQYNTILANQRFQLNGETTHIFFHDYVFWLGDLNFRLDGDTSPTALSEMVASGRLDELWSHDELSRVRSEGRAFSELEEERPTFAPTYKHEFGMTQYSRSRRLAWTDRVLYKVNTEAYTNQNLNVTLDVQQTSYRSVESYTTSDHKPVCAEFKVKVFSHHSDREVSFHPIDTWFLEEENSVVCHLPSDVEPSTWDWIGVFQDNMTNLRDYVSYKYLPYQLNNDHQRSGTDYTLRFSAEAVREPGLYRLLYFTRGSSSLLGISAPFNAVYRNGQPMSLSGTSTQLSPSANGAISTRFLLLAGVALMISYYFNFRML